MTYRVLAVDTLTPARWTEAAALAAVADRQTGRTPPGHAAALRRHQAGWWLALTMLADRTGLPPEQIPLTVGAHGKPLCGTGAGFSVSHAGNFVLCAVADGAVGADIEVPRPVSPAVLTRVCTAAEQAFCGADPRRFLQVWTAKEAYLKFTGDGLAGSPLSVVTADETGMATAVNGHPLTTAATTNYILSVITE